MSLKDIIFISGGAAAATQQVAKIFRDTMKIFRRPAGDKIEPFNTPEARGTRRELDARLKALGIPPAEDARPR